MVTTYAVSPMSSTEVGWFSSSTRTLKVPSFSAWRSEPVFGAAGDPSGLPGGKKPCDRP